MRMTGKTVCLPALLGLLLTSCAKLDTLHDTPGVSPEAFLQQQPWMLVGTEDANIVWTQPSSSVLVLLAALFSMGVGIKFLRPGNRRSPVASWWGIGLLLSGFGALLAGVSYQAFGYAIKCEGREFCTLTSGWEVAYMLFSALGMGAFALGTAYSIAHHTRRKAAIVMGPLAAIAYSACLLYGAMQGIRPMVSFELMMLFTVAMVVTFLAVHLVSWIQTNEPLHRALLIGWILFLAVGNLYGTYLGFEITGLLWEEGIWFTENDVLHLGMIGWVFYIGRCLPLLRAPLPS